MPDASSAGPAPEKVLLRFFRLLESARPADIPAVLAALPEADLAEAVTAMEGRLTRAARDHILARGPASALAASARQAIRGRGEDPDWIIDRVLTRFDPEADEVFFTFNSADPRVHRARRAILRDRQGPDGHAVVAPGVRRRLLALTRAKSRLQEADWWDEVADADDPELLLALMPHAAWLTGRQAARVIATLDAHGLRAEVKRNRGLWECRGSAFSRLGFPRINNLSWVYTFRSDITPVQESMEAVSVDQYRELVGEAASLKSPQAAHRLRVLAWAALRAGTMSPAEVLEHTRPAALAMSLAVSDGGGHLPGEQRAADDMRFCIAGYAAEWLADDPDRWGQAFSRMYTYKGTILELFAKPDSAVRYHFVSVEALPDGAREAANILLALAPADVAARALADPATWDETITAAAGLTPLCRALVDHVVADGTLQQRRELAANGATPDPVLARLMDESADPHLLLRIMGRATAVGREIIERAYALAPRDDQVMRWISGQDPAEALDALRHMAEDPAWVLSVLRVTIPRWRADAQRGRMAAYALLAELIGVEAVWALELELAGSLEAMAPRVRESMAAGDAEPLIEAARGFSAQWPRNLPSWRDGIDLDHPLDRPLENLVRAHLDGRPDRWLHLAALLQATPDARYEDLIAEAARLP
ncbi:hypothetical protein KGQ19_21580 [Catenulispora sp. NL8]|uniref:Uncharacterized protein n=1 Tax=Catenulispora pinistramenti TaxID=2705254 RepID=A0ABS5KTV0_9ACTN|nr:hypothetical protein [Catenulispora pinistramenti]MBS2549459.1 hypothetical protein [Catenulispora pinistramenti]